MSATSISRIAQMKKTKTMVYHCPPPPIIPPWLLLMIILITNVGILNSRAISDDGVEEYDEVPDSPSLISVVSKTHSSVILKWLDLESTEYPTQELIYKIKYKSQWDSNPKSWRTVIINNILDHTLSNPIKLASFPIIYWRNDNFFYLNVTELKYPFSYYEFRIYARFSDALNEDDWSVPGLIALKTKAGVPKRPPRTDIGGFENELSYNNKKIRSVTVFWQNIPNSDKNGDHFEYRVFCTSASSSVKEKYTAARNESRTNHVKFNNLYIDQEYMFTIYSANEVGMSKEFSTLLVPTFTENYGKYLKLTKKLINKEQGVYELSWKNSADQPSIDDNHNSFYTLFWCEFEKHHPDHCNGHFNWTHVPFTENSHIVTAKYSDETYMFAISANNISSLKTDQNNTYEYVSGMIWDSCNMSLNKTYEKMESVWISYVSSTFIQLMWTLECSENLGEILGYRMFYCPTVSVNNTDCAVPMVNETIDGELIHKKRTFTYIRGLQPYTTYQVRISMITDHGETLPSDPMVQTTNEGAPNSQSIVINFTNITQTSFNVQWSPPKFKNGIIRYYRLIYYMEMDEDFYVYTENEESTDSINDYIEQQHELTKRNVTVRDNKYYLEGLEPYKNYVVTIVACTLVCSENSYPFHVRTAIGNPKTVVNPSAMYVNTSSIVISWDRPLVPAGPIDYYKVIVVNYVGTNSTSIEKYRFSPIHLIPSGKRPLNPVINILNTQVTTVNLNIPDCDEPKYSPQTCYIGIQAINNNTLNLKRPFYGDWSKTKILTCGM